MKKILTFVIALGLGLSLIAGGVAFAGANCSASAKACGSKTSTIDAKTASATTTDKSIVLNVSNMTCGSCVSKISSSLAKIDGVGDVSVNLENGTAKVNYASSKVQPELLIAAITKAGFPAKFADSKDLTTDAGTKAACDPANCTTADKAKGCCSKSGK